MSISTNQCFSKDATCGYRAIAVGSLYYSKGLEGNIPEGSSNHKLWRKLKSSSTKTTNPQLEETKKFFNTANIFIHKRFCKEEKPWECTGCNWNNYFELNEPFNSSQYEYMNDYLNDMKQFLVIIDSSNLTTPIYTGRRDADFQAVYIEFIKNETNREGHYNFIKEPRAYVEKRFWCFSCHIGHWDIQHKCDKSCTFCGSYGKCEGGDKIDCEGCGKTFVNKKCYDKHIENSSVSVPKCKFSVQCHECKCIYKSDKKNKHICGEYKCRHCSKRYTEQPHYCMLKPLKAEKLIKEDEVNKIIVCFDIESTFETENNKEVGVENNKDYHKPMLLISGIIFRLICEFINRFFLNKKPFATIAGI